MLKMSTSIAGRYDNANDVVCAVKVWSERCSIDISTSKSKKPIGNLRRTHGSTVRCVLAIDGSGASIVLLVLIGHTLSKHHYLYCLISFHLTILPNCQSFKNRFYTLLPNITVNIEAVTCYHWISFSHNKRS